MYGIERIQIKIVQQVDKDLRDNTFRVQVLDEGEYAGSKWRDELRRQLEQARGD